MISKWQEYSLEQLGEIVTGKTPASSIGDTFNGETPFITPKDMDGRKWIDKTERYLSKVGVKAVESSIVPPNSVAVSCIGSDMGKVAMVRQYSITNQQINTIIVDANQFNPEYIYYTLSLKQKDFQAISSGSATPILNKGHFSKFRIVLPSKTIQDRIVKLISPIDNKIQLNRQINQNLEEIAQAIFKSWFIDFDPVKAKIAAKENGQDPERAAMCAISGKTEAELEQIAPEQLNQLARTASLFPDELVESELGLIPSYWKTVSFGKLLKLTIGGDWGKEKPTDKYTERVKILRGTDLPNIYQGDDSTCPVRLVERSKLDKRKLLNGDIVIEVSGGSKNQPTGRSLYITDTLLTRLDSAVVPASFCRLLRPKRIEYGLLLATHLQKIYKDGKMWTYQVQSTGLSNFQTQVFLENEIVIVPDDEILIIFYNNIKLIYDKIYQSETKILIELKNTLLPKLLSGEISIQQE